MKGTIRDAAQISGHSTHTIVNWWMMCRMVCTGILDIQPKFVGTDHQPVQIDESFFSGRRKYGRGRVLHGDKSRKNDDDDGELEEWGAHRHYGAVNDEDASDWLSVVRIYSSNEIVRFLRVQNRKQETLRFVIEKYVEPGSVVWTDSFSAYNGYSLDAYTHQTVNHSENYVDPNSGVHIQGIKRAWLDAKSWQKRARSNRTYLQSHLNEAA